MLDPVWPGWAHFRIMQRELGLSEEEAHISLQKRSRQLRRPLREVAEAVILSAKSKEFLRLPSSHRRPCEESGSSTRNLFVSGSWREALLESASFLVFHIYGISAILTP
jgi:hypothetical protein